MERTERVIDMKPQVHEIMSRADRKGCVKMKSCFLGKWDFVFGVWGICSSEMHAPRTIAPKSVAWAVGDRGKVTCCDRIRYRTNGSHIERYEVTSCTVYGDFSCSSKIHAEGVSRKPGISLSVEDVDAVHRNRTHGN